MPAPNCQSGWSSREQLARRLYIIHSLESSGRVGPLKLNFIEDSLPCEGIGRKDLLEVIENYKKKPIYREAKKKKEEQEKKKGRKSKASKYSANAQELFTVKGATASKHLQLFQESYATFLTQFSQMAHMLRTSLESGNLNKIRDTFASVAQACDGDAVTRTLRKNLSAAGISSGSSSSGEGSTIQSLIEEERNLCAPSPSVESLTLKHPNSSILEVPPSPTQHKRPVRWTKVKPDPVSSSISSSPTEFACHHQETQCGHSHSKEVPDQINPSVVNVNGDKLNKVGSLRSPPLPRGSPKLLHNNNATKTTKKPLLPPTNKLQKGMTNTTHSLPPGGGNDSDEDIYTSPGTSGTRCTSPPPRMEDVTYSNYPVRYQQTAVPGSENQVPSRVTLPMVGSGRVINPSVAKPVPPPKPKQFTEAKQHKAVNNDGDYSSTYSNTYTGSGDSGFSDSQAFMKVPLHSVHHQAPGHTYASLNKAEVQCHTADDYKSLNRDSIPPHILN